MTTNQSSNKTSVELVNQLSGILLPTTTPFLGDGVDLSGLRTNLSKWNQHELAGYVLLGSTGERVHLSEHEFSEIVACARAEVTSDKAFIVGAGQQSTIGSINEIKVATSLGADAVLVITPHFYRSAMTQEALVSFYRAVADAATIPVLLYSMPALTGIKIEPETIALLSEHPNIVGVKDSSNDMKGFAETRRLCPEEFAVITGNGTVLLDALRSGATAGILAVGCVAPLICLEVLRAFRSGESERCDQLQSKLTPLAAAVTTRFGIGGLKSALDMAGYVGGEVRAPLQMPDQSARDEISTLLRDATAELQSLTAKL